MSMRSLLAGCFAVLTVVGSANAQEDSSRRLKMMAQEKARLVKLQGDMHAVLTRVMTPCLAPKPDAPATTLRIYLNRDGTLASKPLVLTVSDPAAAQVAIRAVIRCITSATPVKLDPALYDYWREFNYVVKGTALPGSAP